MTKDEILKRCEEWFAAYMHDRENYDEATVLLAALRNSASDEPTAEEYAEKALGIAMDAYDEARDAARLEWVMRNVSGAEWRRLGVLYGDFDGIRRAIDAALSSPENRPVPRENPQWTPEEIEAAKGKPHTHMWSGIGPDAHCLGCCVLRGSGEL